jgi:hypothetical protein
MPIIADPTVHAQHPSWCSPAHCATATPVDVRHSGAPVVITPEQDDAEVSVALVRDDEHNRDGGLVSSIGGVSLRLLNLESVRAGCGCPIDADTVFTPAEARKLADQLNALADQADQAAVTR